MTLPPRRAAFVREYLVDLNASRAARDVGYAPKSASVEASRLLANPEVQTEITRQRAILAEQSNVTPEKIVAELAVTAFSDMGDFIKVVNGIPLLDLAGIDPSKLRAIASVKHDANGTTIKLHDKHAALVTLARTLGMVQDGSTNVLIQTHDTVKMKALTTEELRKSLDSGVFDVESPEESTGSGLLEERTGSEASE
jgi:phage terminase small subunit